MTRISLCSLHGQQPISCQSISHLGYRVARLVVREWMRPRLLPVSRQHIAQVCFRLGERRCCSSKRFGVLGRSQCWHGLPSAPWYQLCCGNSRRHLSRTRKRMSFALPLFGPVVSRVPFPDDAPCFPERDWDRCAVFFLTYHKTGNFLGNRLREILQETLFPKKPGTDLHSSIWKPETCDIFKASESKFYNADCQPFGRDIGHLVPIARIPATHASITQRQHNCFGGKREMSRCSSLARNKSFSHIGWHHLHEPASPVLVSMSEDIPIVANRWYSEPSKFEALLSARAPLPSSFRGRVVHMVRRPVDLVASAFKFHMKDKLREHTNFGMFHWLRCNDCGSIEWEYIFRMCKFQCSYLELLQHVANKSVEEGVLLEYVRSRNSLKNMLGNIAGWSNNSYVLHLTPEHFRNWPTEAVACLMRFLLGYRDELEPWRWSAPEELVEHIASKFNTVVAESFSTEGAAWNHATFHERRWSSSELKDALLWHPH